jgi:2-aminoethylphosphonate dioxygenase
MIDVQIKSDNQNVEPWVTEYQERGFVKLCGVFSSAEMDAVREDYNRIFANPEILREDSLRAASRKSLLTGTVLDRLDPIIDLSPVIHRLTQDPRIVDAAAKAIGEPVLLFKDKAIMKPPGAFGYGTHQDFTNWQELPVPPHLLLSVLVPLDSASAANGALQCYPGLHHEHLRSPEKPSDIFNPNAGLVDPALLGDVQPELIETEPGDLVLFSSLTPHFSGPNQSDRKRQTLFLSYSAARFGDLYNQYYTNFYGYLAKDRNQM